MEPVFNGLVECTRTMLSTLLDRTAMHKVRSLGYKNVSGTVRSIVCDGFDLQTLYKIQTTCSIGHAGEGSAKLRKVEEK